VAIAKTWPLDVSTFREYKGAMLGSIDDVISTLGGTAKVAGLCGVGQSAVSNWRTRGRIPAEKFLIFDGALEKLNVRADPALFGFEPAEPAT
jgi:hypothetical protein